MAISPLLAPAMYVFFLFHPRAQLARLLVLLRQIRDETQRCCGKSSQMPKRWEAELMMPRPTLLFHRSFSQLKKNEEQETMFVCVEEM